MRMLLHACLLLAATLTGVFTLTNPTTAQTKSGDAKTLDKAVYDALGVVINHGADLFNNYGNHAGCYEAYRAGLMAVRPLLAHRPEAQKTIDSGLAAAEEKFRVTERAFVLRKVLGKVRKDVYSGTAPVVAKTLPEKKGSMGMSAEKKSEPKRVTETKKPVETKKIVDTATPKKEPLVNKKSPSPALNMARISGKLSYKGKAVTGGWYVTLMSATDKHTFSTYVRPDGSYTFKTPVPPGTYTVAIEEGPRDKANPPAGRVAIPERYQNPVTSGLTVQVRPGQSVFDVDLQ